MSRIRTEKKKTTGRRNAETGYTPVAKNIYQSKDSFRVRITINGVRYSKNFISQRRAVLWRNELKRTAA